MRSRASLLLSCTSPCGGGWQLGLLALGAMAAGPALSAADVDGEAIYRNSCAACHESGENRAPGLDALRKLSPAAIEASLTDGTMAAIGRAMPEGYAAAVARFLGREASAVEDGTVLPCPDPHWRAPAEGPRWAGWGTGLHNRRFQPAAHAGLDGNSVGELQLRWVFGLPDADRARGAPTVAGGRLFLGTLNGEVVALGAGTGCTAWRFQARAEVRTAIVFADADHLNRQALYFGDTKANLYSVNAATGELLWRTSVDEHPAATLTGSPVLHEGRLYTGVSSIEEFTGAFADYGCCTFRGSVLAIDASNGERIWKVHTIPDEPEPQRPNKRRVTQYGPSGAAIWSAPTIDARLGRLYVTTGDNYSDPPTEDSDAIIAFRLDSGERLWSRQFTQGDAYNMACDPSADKVNCPEADGPDFDFGSSAMLVELGEGRRALVAGQKSGFVHAVDPDRDGALLWTRQAGRGGKLGGIQFGPAADSQNAYVAVSDFAGARPDSVGGLTAYRLIDGKEVWHVPAERCPDRRKGCSPGHSAAVTAIPGVVFSGSLDGILRAYSTANGEILWRYDTVRSYPGTVNGVAAEGGSLNGPGPVVVGGMLYVNSGYGQFGTTPGNAFLAFGLP